MKIVSSVLIGVVAALQFYFMVLEMFLWNKPYGLKVFGHSLEQANASAVMAANQGLYNGFLAAGLVWALVHPSVEVSQQLAFFFLGCVFVAGLYGAYSAEPKILFFQALPALLALVFVYLR